MSAFKGESDLTLDLFEIMLECYFIWFSLRLSYFKLETS